MPSSQGAKQIKTLVLGQGLKGVMSYKHFPRAAVARTRAMNQQNLVNTVAKAFMHTIGR